ncbi:MAG TPA: hypothetical protein DCL21_03555 [Alphaproteobacteria bacterium]|nr:hypothetical protein [Alphaproteobacteria bacterium]
MKKTFLVITSILTIIILASAAIFLINKKPTVEQFIAEKGLPQSVEFFNEQNYILNYSVSRGFGINKEKNSIKHDICSIKFNIKNNKVTNPENNIKSCEEFVMNKEGDGKRFQEKIQRIIDGNKIKAQLSNKISDLKNHKDKKQ